MLEGVSLIIFLEQYKQTLNWRQFFAPFVHFTKQLRRFRIIDRPQQTHRTKVKSEGSVTWESDNCITRLPFETCLPSSRRDGPLVERCDCHVWSSDLTVSVVAAFKLSQRVTLFAARCDVMWRRNREMTSAMHRRHSLQHAIP